MGWLDCYRLSVYVPEDGAQAFLQTIRDKIPQIAENYDRVCWYSATGREQFRPLEGARPAAGEIGQTIINPSVKFEFTLPRDDVALDMFVEEIRTMHPWEDPVITVQEIRASRP